MMPISILYAISSSVIGFVILNYIFNAKRYGWSDKIKEATPEISKISQELANVKKMIKLLSVNESIHAVVDIDCKRLLLVYVENLLLIYEIILTCSCDF